MLEQVKSSYLLANIIKDYLDDKRYLKIAMYNKVLQSRLNIDKTDYKKFYNRIEIELKPIDILSKDNDNIFINRLDNKKNYYHIYFNNDYKTEITRRHLTPDDKVNKIKIIIDEEIDSLIELFYACDCIKEISFIKFKRKNIINMISMFEECRNLVKVDISKIKTDSINNMKAMFRSCSSLKEIDLSNFNTSKVENFHSLFYECSSLKKINISNLDTSKVTNMSYMFFGCSSLEGLNIILFLIKFLFYSIKYYLNFFIAN